MDVLLPLDWTIEETTGQAMKNTNSAIAWWDEHVSTSVNQHDFTNMGRNNALAVLPRLGQEPHNLKPMTPRECNVGGLRDGNVCYGLYNKSWNCREVKSVPM
jgi:2,3-dihydroxybenzoate decarboxylase